ncbi:MAG: DUF4252 domain-containing protein [Acidobacteriota bacterium]
MSSFRLLGAVALVAALLWSAAPRAEAQPEAPPPAETSALESHPGYVPLGELALLPEDSLSVEVDLSGPLLRLIAGATRSEDQDFSSLISGLLSIRVQVGSVAAGDAKRVDRRAAAAARWLDDHGWHPTVRMRDGNGRNYIYLKEQDGDLVGLTVVAFEHDQEAVLVNIVGRIDPEGLGELAGRFDLPGLLGVDSTETPSDP